MDQPSFATAPVEGLTSHKEEAKEEAAFICYREGEHKTRMTPGSVTIQITPESVPFASGPGTAPAPVVAGSWCFPIATGRSHGCGHLNVHQSGAADGTGRTAATFPGRRGCPDLAGLPNRARMSLAGAGAAHVDNLGSSRADRNRTGAFAPSAALPDHHPFLRNPESRCGFREPLFHLMS